MHKKLLTTWFVCGIIYERLKKVAEYADVAELADALDLGSSVARREGSSPFIRTRKNGLLKQTVFSLILVEEAELAAF